MFHKSISAIGNDSFDRSEHSKLKTFWKGFTIPDAIKNIHVSKEEVKITLMGVLKKLILTDFEGFETSVEYVTANMMKPAGELE